MNTWVDDLGQQVSNCTACVLVTVAQVRGSAPREVGAKMVVTDRETIGTIGGGQLEYKCAQIAWEYLRDERSGSQFRTFTLGANCGQCCGGVVEILFESFCVSRPDWIDRLREAYRCREPVIVATGVDCKYLISAGGECRYTDDASPDCRVVDEAVRILSRAEAAQRVRCTLDDGTVLDLLLEPVLPTAMDIAVFGAGHVGAATVNVLSSLDCNIRWVDSRRHIFPARLPDNVQSVESARPELEVAAMPAGAAYLVMTHSHPLDLEIVEQILRRNDYSYCGLIGSVSKRRRFEKRLRQLGLAQASIDRLVSPIGIAGIRGKEPAEIAIAVAAELLTRKHARAETDNDSLPENVRLLHQ